MLDSKINPDQALDKILNLIEDSRLLAAEALYVSLMSYVSTLTSDSAENVAINERLSSHGEIIELMLERVVRVKDALETSAHVDEDSGWIHGVTLFGVTTHYKVQEDNSLLLRLQGSREDLPLFEQLAVVHEVDLYPTWVPFCNYGKMLTKITHSDLIAHFSISMLMFSREAAVRFYGVDCLFEEGTVVLLGHSLDTWEDPPIPWKPSGIMHDKMIFKQFKAMIKLESPVSAKIVVIASLDPRAPIPHVFRNFILQKLAGVIVYTMQTQAEKILEDHNCEHSQRMLRNKEFYAEWLLPKFRAYCDYMRWEQPTISALGQAGIPPGGSQARSSINSRNSILNTTKDQVPSAMKQDSAVAVMPSEVKPRRVVRFAQIVEEIDVDPTATNALIEEAIAIFKEKDSLFDALDYLVSKNFIIVKPQNIAGFLLKYGAKFDVTAVGDLLGEDINMDDEGLLWSEVRYKFVRAAFFIEMDVEAALRKFLTECGFKLPSESSKIERLMNAFVRVFWEDNNKTPYAPFDHMENVNSLVVAMLALNSSCHGSGNGKIISEEDFLLSLRMPPKVIEVNRKYFAAVYMNVVQNALDDVSIGVDQIKLEETDGANAVVKKEVPELVQQAVKMSKEKIRKPLQNALRFLVNKQFIGDSPREVAKFLLSYHSLFDPGLIGEMLGEEGKTKDDKHRCSQLRYRFIRATSFTGLNIELALRKFLTECGFRLPTDGQKIDCLVGSFVRVFWEDNHNTPLAPFKHMDTVHLLVLAIILLDGDLHSADVSEEEKMTKDVFVGDLHGVDRDKNNVNDKPSDINEEMLSNIYDSVKLVSLHKPLNKKEMENKSSVAEEIKLDV
mmetsp:Transcript_8235/g.8399  ORF Transcript_8235/g.8399 Transcript_8235/m.8399 type:complete len:841 (+) Transcript_8235:183-2705(+)